MPEVANYKLIANYKGNQKTMRNQSWKNKQCILVDTVTDELYSWSEALLNVRLHLQLHLQL